MKVDLYDQLSVVAMRFVDLEKAKTQSNSSSVQDLRVQLAKDVKKFIKIGDNNEGLRLLNLAFASAFDYGKVKGLVGGSSNENDGSSWGGAWGESWSSMNNLFEDLSEENQDTFMTVVESFKQLTSSDSMVRAMNWFSIDEQRVLLENYLDSYINHSGRRWLWKKVLGFVDLFGAGKRAAVQYGFKTAGNLFGTYKNNYKEFPAIASILTQLQLQSEGEKNKPSDYLEIKSLPQEKGERKGVLQKKLEGSLGLVETFSGFVHDYINAKNKSASDKDGVQSVLDQLKHFLVDQQGPQGNEALETLKFISEVVTEELLADERYPFCREGGEWYRLCCKDKDGSLPETKPMEECNSGAGRCKPDFVIKENEGGSYCVRVFNADQDDQYEDIPIPIEDEKLNESIAECVSKKGSRSKTVRPLIDELISRFNIGPSTIMRELLAHHIPDMDERAAAHKLVRTLVKQGAPILMLNKLLSRLDIEAQELIVKKLFSGEKAPGLAVLDMLAQIVGKQPDKSFDRYPSEAQPDQVKMYQVDKLAQLGVRLVGLHQGGEGELNAFKRFVKGQGNYGFDDKKLLLEVIRNVGGQENFSDAMTELKNKVPTFLHESVDSMVSSYFLSDLSKVSFNLLQHMSDEAILNLLSAIPDEAIDLIHTKITRSLERLGDTDNNLHTTLSKRSDDKQKRIQKALSALDEGVLSALIGDGSDGEERFVKWFTDGKGQTDPSWMLPPVKASRAALVDALGALNKALDDSDEQPIERRAAYLLGTPASEFKFNDREDIQVVTQDIASAQDKAIAAFIRLLEDMGIALDFTRADEVTNEEKGNAAASPSRFCDVKSQLITLRAVLASYPLAKELSLLIDRVVPESVDGLNENGSSNTINIEDRVTMLKEALAALSPSQPVSGRSEMEEKFNANAGIAVRSSNATELAIPAEDDLIRDVWKFTEDLVGKADTTVVLNEKGQFCSFDGQTIKNDASDVISCDTKVTSGGAGSQIIFNMDGSVVNEEGDLLSRGSEEANRLLGSYSADLEEAQSVLKDKARKELKKVVKANLNTFIHMLSEYNSRDELKGFFERAELPPSMQNMLISLIGKVLPPDILDSESGKKVIKSVARYPRPLKDKLLDSVPDKVYDGLLGQLVTVINFLDPFEELPFFNKFSKTLEASLGEVKVIQKLVGVLTKGYFKEIPHCDKRQISLAVLKVGKPTINKDGSIDPESLKELIGAITQSGGPGFQKAMQLFKGDVKEPSIKKALDDMDDSVSPMSDEEVLAQIEADIDKVPGPDGASYRLLTEEELEAYRKSLNVDELKPSHLKRLGSATIAQTHMVYVTTDKTVDGKLEVKPMVAKIQRPQIRHRILREMKALRSIRSVGPGVEKTLKSLEESIMDETDFNREYEFGQLMKGLYTRDNLGVTNMVGAHNRLLLQEFSPGETLSSHWSKMRDDASIKGKVSDAVIEHLWNGVKIEPKSILTDENKKEIKDEIERALEDALSNNCLTQVGQTVGEVVCKMLSDAANANLTPSLDKLKKTIGSKVAHELEQAVREKLDEQMAFLKSAGDAVSLLVGQFAAAAFVGDAKGIVSKELNFYDVGRSDLPDLSKQNKNSVVVYKKIENGAAKYTVRCRAEASDKPEWSLDVQADSELYKQLNTWYGTWSRFGYENLALKGDIANSIRRASRHNVLFKGEGFIDSDRHGGNLLYDILIKRLKCIDTGAGTIITEHERRGMITFALGIAYGNIEAVMEGLETMIPDIRKVDERYAGGLKKALYSSIRGGHTENEKIEDLYSFMLSSGMIDSETSVDILDGLEHKVKSVNRESPEYKSLDFSKPDEAIEAFKAYLKGRGLEHVADKLDDPIKGDLKAMMQNLDYSRVVGKRGLVDGENSLLFIKSIRKVANVLDRFDVNAPEPIIQLNRGAKFIDDQAKAVNEWKADAKMLLGAYNASLEGDEGLDEPKKEDQAKSLKPIDLGVAYVNGLLDRSDKLSALAGASDVGFSLQGVGSLFNKLRGSQAGSLIESFRPPRVLQNPFSGDREKSKDQHQNSFSKAEALRSGSERSWSSWGSTVWNGVATVVPPICALNKDSALGRMGMSALKSAVPAVMLYKMESLQPLVTSGVELMWSAAS